MANKSVIQVIDIKINKTNYKIGFLNLNDLFADYTIGLSILMHKKILPTAKAMGISNWWNGSIFQITSEKENENQLQIPVGYLVDPIQLFDLTDLLQQILQGRVTEEIQNLINKNTQDLYKIEKLLKQSNGNGMVINFLYELRNVKKALPSLGIDVFISKSKLNNAGNGVFANRKIKKGEVLGFYGNYILDTEVSDLMNNGPNIRHNYQQKWYNYATRTECLRYVKGSWEDFSKDTNAFYFHNDSSFFEKNYGEFANHPNASWIQYMNDNYTEENSENVAFVQFKFAPFFFPQTCGVIGQPLTIIAIKDIDVGEELYLNYGSDYWQSVGFKRTKLVSAINYSKISSDWFIEMVDNCSSLTTIEKNNRKNIFNSQLEDSFLMGQFNYY